MLKFWYIETLLLPPSLWLTEPWHQGIECYRDWSTAREQLDLLIAYYQSSKPSREARLLPAWREAFGGHPPPMPDTPTVCRLVECKGQERKVGAVQNGRFRRAAGPTGRARWTRTEKTLYLVCFRDPERRGRTFLDRPRWNRPPNVFVAFRRQRDAVLRALDERRLQQITVLGVEAQLTESRRRASDQVVRD